MSMVHFEFAESCAWGTRAWYLAAWMANEILRLSQGERSHAEQVTKIEIVVFDVKFQLLRINAINIEQ